MPSLNMLASEDAHILKDPLNIALKETIKRLYRELSAKYLRQSIERNGIDDVMRKGYIAELEAVSALDPCIITGCKVMRTKWKVPKPLRYKSDVPFLYVGQASLLKPKSYIYILPQEMPYITTYKLNSNIPRYFYLDNYIYFINTGLVDKVRIINIFENPSEVISYCEVGCEDDDTEYPIPMDLISAIKTEILTILGTKGEIPNPDVENNVRMGGQSNG